MTCITLTKNILSTFIPGNPGVPAFAGVPATPAFCSTEVVTDCTWFPNPTITWGPLGIPYYMGIPLWQIAGGVGVQINKWNCQPKSMTTCYPAQPAIPGTPGIAPTPSQIIINKQEGWNSSSRSIAPLEQEQGVLITPAVGIMGAFIGLAPAGYDAYPPNLFTHGLMIDLNGVRVYESGAFVDTLASGYSGTAEISIERALDDTITYKIVDGSTVTYDSLDAIPVGDIYAYVMLYAGGDRVDACGTVCTGTLPFYDLDGDGDATFPALASNGGDYALAQGDAHLTALYTAASGGMYVPPTPTHAYGNLPLLTSWSLVLESHPGDGDAALPPAISLAGDYQFGFASAWTPALASYGEDDNRLKMFIMGDAIASGPFTPTRDLMIVLNSSGELVSSMTAEIHVLAEIMSALLLDDAYTLLGQYDLSLFSSLRGASYQTHPGALDALGKVWVVNVDTAAAWRYEGYGFNSFFKRGEKYYGVAEDGIYLLEGADDAGVNIDARLDTGRSNFGESKTKTVPSVYLAVASEDVMVLRVEADGQEYFYEARSSSAELKNHRVDVGRGLEGAHWSFSVLNKDGADFDLASMEFAPILNKRRV